MSVYPLYLVLGQDGTIGAYARKDVLKIDLMQNLQAGHAAIGVWEYDKKSMRVVYNPTHEYDDLLVQRTAEESDVVDQHPR